MADKSNKFIGGPLFDKGHQLSEAERRIWAPSPEELQRLRTRYSLDESVESLSLDDKKNDEKTDELDEDNKYDEQKKKFETIDNKTRTELATFHKQKGFKPVCVYLTEEQRLQLINQRYTNVYAIDQNALFENMEPPNMQTEKNVVVEYEPPKGNEQAFYTIYVSGMMKNAQPAMLKIRRPASTFVWRNATPPQPFQIGQPMRPRMMQMQIHFAFQQQTTLPWHNFPFNRSNFDVMLEQDLDSAFLRLGGITRKNSRLFDEYKCYQAMRIRAPLKVKMCMSCLKNGQHVYESNGIKDILRNMKCPFGRCLRCNRPLY